MDRSFFYLPSSTLTLYFATNYPLIKQNGDILISGYATSGFIAFVFEKNVILE